MAAGEINAIRDWANGYFYTKEEISEMFIKSTTSGLKAYLLTFAASKNTDIVLVENTQTDPQSYSFNVGPLNIYKSVFFFHQNATILVNGNSVVLDSYEKTIIVSANGYLPLSNPGNIVCAIPKESAEWGASVTSPLELSTSVPLNTTEDARYVKAKTDGVIGKIDLGTGQDQFTAYIVCKLDISTANAYSRVLSSCSGRSADNSIMLTRMSSGSTVHVSEWGDNDTDTNVPIGQYFAAALRYTAQASSAGFVMGATGNAIKKSKTSLQHGRYLVIGATDENFASITNLEPSDVFVKFIGVVNESESDSVIENNLSQLRTLFMS